MKSWNEAKQHDASGAENPDACQYLDQGINYPVQEASTETICCEHCGFEYDRHIGDECPNCGHMQSPDEELIDMED